MNTLSKFLHVPSAIRDRQRSRASSPAPSTRSRTPKRAPWTVLPPELLVLVMAELHAALYTIPAPEQLMLTMDRDLVRNDSALTAYLRAPQRAFAAHIALCRAWYLSGVALLYTHPRLASLAHLSLFARTAAASPDLAAHVRALALAKYDARAAGEPVLRKLRTAIPPARAHPDLALIFRACPEMAELTLACRGELQQSVFHWPVLAAAAPPRLRTLALGGSWTPIWELFPSGASSAFADLEELSLKIVMLSPRDADESRPAGQWAWPPFPALRRVRYYTVLQRAPAVPSLPPAALTHVQLYGTDIDWEMIVDALAAPALRASLEVLHLVGRYEWRALTQLPLAEFTSLRQLAYGVIQPYINVLFDPAETQFPKSLKTVILAEWAAAHAAPQVEDLCKWVGSKTWPVGMEEIHVAYGEHSPDLAGRLSELLELGVMGGVKVTMEPVSKMPRSQKIWDGGLFPVKLLGHHLEGWANAV